MACGKRGVDPSGAGGHQSGLQRQNIDRNAAKGRAANVKIATVTDKSSDAFAAMLDSTISEHGPFEIVMVDPAFAYLGGDSNSQKDVSRFMRELLNPLVQRHGVGLFLAHHTNKPLRGKEKDGWSAGDYAYLGAGSAEWINPARAALAIRSIGSESVFELRAVKRGKRLRWVDDEGQPTNMQYIAHHGEPGVICWRKATADEIEDVTAKAKGGRPKQANNIECVHAISKNPGESQTFYVDLLAGKLGCGKTTARRMLKECVETGWLSESGKPNCKRYTVTAEGKKEAEKRPSVVDWA